MGDPEDTDRGPGVIQLDRDKSTQSRRQAHNLHRSHNQSADFGETHHSGPGLDCLCRTCTQGRDLKYVPGVVKRESSGQDGLVVFVDQCHPQGHTINQAQIYLEVDIGKSVAGTSYGAGIHHCSPDDARLSTDQRN